MADSQQDGLERRKKSPRKRTKTLRKSSWESPQGTGKGTQFKDVAAVVKGIAVIIFALVGIRTLVDFLYNPLNPSPDRWH